MSGQVLLVMDLQQIIVDQYGEPGAAAVGGSKRAMAAARAAGVPVVLVQIAHRSGAPEMSARNKLFAPYAAAGVLADDQPTSAIVSDVAGGDAIVVTKRRVSAFAGSDLGVLLRALGASRLVLCGIATSGVVLSTVRQAADLDYELTVLSDACADADADVHRVLLERVFPSQADVVTIDDWAASLG